MKKIIILLLIILIFFAISFLIFLGESYFYKKDAHDSFYANCIKYPGYSPSCSTPMNEGKIIQESLKESGQYVILLFLALLPVFMSIFLAYSSSFRNKKFSSTWFPVLGLIALVSSYFGAVILSAFLPIFRNMDGFSELAYVFFFITPSLFCFEMIFAKIIRDWGYNFFLKNNN